MITAHLDGCHVSRDFWCSLKISTYHNVYRFHDLFDFYGKLIGKYTNLMDPSWDMGYVSRAVVSRRLGMVWDVLQVSWKNDKTRYTMTHMLHVWYIYLHLA